MKLFSLVLPLVCVALVACGGDTGTDGTGGDDNGNNSGCGDARACTTSNQCPLGQVCGGEGCCEAASVCPAVPCAAGTFCNDELQCVDVATACLSAPGGCECYILNTAGQLEADVDTEPQIFVSGGQTIRVAAVLAGTNDRPFPGATATFVVDSSAVVTPSGDQLTAGAGAGTATLTAIFGGQTLSDCPASGGDAFACCSAQVTNLGTPAGGVRFFAFDNLTGDPVAGARVIVDVNGDGQDDLPAPITTGPDGLVTSNNVSGTFDVTVFKSGFNYLSIVGLSGLTDVALPLAPRKEPAVTGGFSGRMDFAEYEAVQLGGLAKDIKFAFASSSFPLQSLLNFDLDLFLGSFDAEADCSQSPVPAGCYNVEITGVYDDVVPLPGGVSLQFSNVRIKNFFDVVAVPGRRYAWTLGGELETGDIGPLLNVFLPLAQCTCNTPNMPGVCQEGCACDIDCGLNLNFRDIINGVVPLFPNFAAGVKGNIPTPEALYSDWEQYVVQPYEDADGNLLRAANVNFVRLDSGAGNRGRLVLREPLRTFTSFVVPTLPVDPGLPGADDRMEAMFVLAGVNARGYGFVPMGFGVGLDCTVGDCLDRATGQFNGQIDPTLVCKHDPDPTKSQCAPDVLALAPGGTLPSGNVGVFSAKAHGGLEGQEWMTIAVALPVSDLVDTAAAGGGAVRATAFIQRSLTPPAQGSSSVLNDATRFPEFPATPSGVTGRGAGTPTYQTGAAVDRVDLQWVTVTGGGDNPSTTVRWNVYFAGGADTFAAPSVPVGFEDPFADTSGELNVTHVGFDLPAGVSLPSLVANNGTTLNDLLSLFEGFSVQNANIPLQ